MIMIRSGGGQQKETKPPPPVPPRPSKTLVQEALAKTRQVADGGKNEQQNGGGGKCPIRAAPPPPQASQKGGVIKSNSTCTINVPLKKPAIFERSVSEEKATTPRPIVYQSPNMKASNNSKINIIRKESMTKKNVVEVNIGNGEEEEKKEVKEKLGGSEEFIVNCVESCDNIVINNDSSSKSSTLEKTMSSIEKTSDSSSSTNSSKSNSLDKKWDRMLNDRNHVNTLIDEMFASVLEVNSSSDESSTNNVRNNRADNKIIINNRVSDEEDEKAVPTTVIVITDRNDGERHSRTSSASPPEQRRKVKFSDDRMNHEFLIEELQHMKEDQKKIMRRQRKPSLDLYEDSDKSSDSVTINGWTSVSDSGEKVRMSSCHIVIDDAKHYDDVELDYERISKMSHLHGLPPLPKSLSGFNLLDGQGRSGHQSGRIGSGRPSPPQPPTLYSPHAKLNGERAKGGSTNLDAQLAVLRREMYSLRQQDLSLLSQLWSLNESIQDFRQILQEQEERVLSPPSPSPAPSSCEDDEDDDSAYYAAATNSSAANLVTAGYGSRLAATRKLSGSSAASGSVG